MSHYQSNMRDLEFNLFEVFGVDKLLGSEAYPDIDVDTARSVLAEAARMARDDIGASYASSDREPPVFDPATHSVVMPGAFRKSYESFMDAEFWRMDMPGGLDGTPAPRTLWWAFAEMVLGSNAPVWMYASGPSFATTLWREGTDEQKRWAKLFVDKRWGATMVLTEPDAGSDVGAGRTRAVPQPDGSWHIEGVKRFITSGEHDLSDNIIHYVLARPAGTPGAGGPGTKGLSLFVVPKFHFDPETGELGDRNGVFVTNVEHKMGLKASATCEVAFGEHGVPAKGWLLGDVHDGIRQMFLIIEYARMMVGTKAIATLSTGYLNALDYARSRVQGADLTRQSDKNAPRVTITHHPDVRRSLMLQKAYAEGMRALVLYTASWQDARKVAEVVGDEATVETAKRVNNFLLPILKGFGSERAYELLGSESLQTFGGSGFLQDYPIEQYIRDSKIDTLYEGTTAIQSLDLIFRKIAKDRGVALAAVAAEIQAFLASGDDHSEPAANAAPAGERLSPEPMRSRSREALGAEPMRSRSREALGAEPMRSRSREALGTERAALGTALAEASRMVGALTNWIVAAQDDPRELYKVGLNSRRVLLAIGDLLVGWLLQRQASVALDALGRDELSEADRSFYQGKVAAARFFAHEVLPRLGADRRIVESTTLDLMDLAEDAF